ncbi:MAG: T9SS type A sorting domain-containing protein [bacterium]
MKRSLLIFLLAVTSLLGVSQIFAQSDTNFAKIAFTNSERTAILRRTIGGKRTDTLFTSYGAVQLKNLSVLASTKNGKSLMIGGKAVFFNPLNSAQDSAWAIARIDSPFHNTGGFNPLAVPLTIGGAKILKIVYSDLTNDPFLKLLPLGVLAPNEKDWYFTPVKASAGGQQWFFHGTFDGLSPVDSLQITGDFAAVTGGYPGYFMTNLVVSNDSKTMAVVVFDGYNATYPRAQVFRWTPSTTGGGFAFSPATITGQVKNARSTAVNIDSSMAFCLHTLPGTGTCELALQPNFKGDIQFFTIPFSGSVNLTPGDRATIQRTKLPAGADTKPLHFFTGYTNSPVTADDDKEVIAPGTGYPLGNGGDMMFSYNGTGTSDDSLVFVTCNSGDVATNAESGIYMYDFNNQKVTLVYNDPTKMERQPIFAGYEVHKYKIPDPPKYVPGVAILDSSSIKFGLDSIGDAPIIIAFNIIDTSQSPVYLKSITINGNNAGVFSVVTPTITSPITIAKGQKQVIIVKFTPSLPEQTYSSTVEIHYNDTLSSDNYKKLTLDISGTSIKKKVITGGGVVRQNASSIFDLNITPNPFTSSAEITISAKENTSSSLEIHDVLGKEIYSSKVMSLSVGDRFKYTLDANSMHLSPGTYFVIVRSGGDELTRQAIYVK